MTLAEAVLAGNAKAWAQVADLVRAKGGRYADGRQFVRDIFRRANKPPPSDAEYEDMMLEADYLESKERRR